MRKKPLIIAISAALALLLACILIYLFAFKTLTIVSDNAFSVVLKRFSMATKGIRVRVETLENDAFDSPQSFVSRLEKVKGNWVLLSPVSSAYAADKKINVSDLLPNSTVIALYNEKASSLFDCTLVSDEKSGWIKAAKALSSEFEKTSSNVALIYEKDTVPYVQDIKDCFSESRLSVFEDDGSSKLFFNETQKNADELSIVVAMCPYDSRLSEFFKTPGTLSWVVDYRFEKAVSPKQLYGIVVPAFARSLKAVLDTEKGSSVVATLEYDYEKL